MNIAEILKDCPKGTKLYSPVFGDVEFDKVTQGSDEVCGSIDRIRVEYLKKNRSMTLYANGKMADNPDAECMLFPSKDNRDWSTFVPPCKFKTFDKVVGRNINEGCEWFADLFSHYDADTSGYVCIGAVWKECLPYNEETAKLIGTQNDYKG